MGKSPSPQLSHLLGAAQRPGPRGREAMGGADDVPSAEGLPGHLSRER